MRVDLHPKLVAIRNQLIADPSVYALIAKRVHDHVPQPPTYPYSEFGAEFFEPWDTTDTEGAEWFPTIHVHSQKRGRTECRAIMTAITLALHDREPPGFVFLQIDDARIERRTERQSTHGIIRLRALITN